MKYVTVRDYLVELIDTRLSVGDVVLADQRVTADSLDRILAPRRN